MADGDSDVRQDFGINPVLNSPYAEPEAYWELDKEGLPTGEVVRGRRRSEFLIPIPSRSRRRRGGVDELALKMEEREEENSKVSVLRRELKNWRDTPLERRNLSGVTVRLLRHWRGDDIQPRPFFCQLEAVETFIWLNEVAPKSRNKEVRNALQEIAAANEEANMGLPRLAAKMATGSGKTTVMAMLIAYHAVNHFRSPKQKSYAGRFLIIAPGITIKDRLRVLLPQDPNNYYEKNGIVPSEMLGDVRRAEVIITNYHAFRQREKSAVSKRQREMLKGHDDKGRNTSETDGEMLQRVCPELIRGGQVVVINDEAHHCYIHKKENEEGDIEPEEKEDAKRNNEAARLWINGIKALRGKVEIKSVYDLSATPFFLRGSGYSEGTLFQWVVSDFSLMDAIESGIVKLPRVPVRDSTTVTGGDGTPIYRDLYRHIRADLPRRGRGTQVNMDPQDLPSELMGALQSLYTHYEKTVEVWKEGGVDIPPVFIIVCNNTSTSKLVYDYISGYKVKQEDGTERWHRGKFSLFDNVNERGEGLLARPSTLLIDSYQLESGEILTDEFKEAAAAEIDLFKREYNIRHHESGDINKIGDEELLREVMNTVGKRDRLGEQIRCVVSVSMLTEGWDTNNVTHILGVRAFGTQLLCEQVVGRALRRYSYEVEENDKYSVEYANIYGVPFKFAPSEGTAAPKPPKPQFRVRHLDERAELEIVYPRVRGYRIKPPEERLVRNFTSTSHLVITPDMAPPKTEQRGIIGEGEILDLSDLERRRLNEVVYFLSAHIVKRYYKDERGGIAPSRFRDLVPIVREWLENCVDCIGGTCKQYLLWEDVAKKGGEYVYRACAPKEGKESLLPVMDPFTPEGSTLYVDFLTRKQLLHETAVDKSHINLAVCDSGWEMQFCQLLEEIDGVRAYVKNDGLGFEVPYTHQKEERQYRPDFIILMDDGEADLLNLVVEIKGIRDDKARAKADTMNKLWIPAINNDGRWGRWAFEEIMDPQDMRLTGGDEPAAILKKYTKGGKKG